MHTTFVQLLIASAVLLGGNAERNKLEVDIYYETLCPDSIAFFNNQLLPNYNDLKHYISLRLIPFGKSRSIHGGEAFECQHGELECYFNMVQSCGLHFLEGMPDAQMAFTGCIMETDEMLKAASVFPTSTELRCAEMVHIDQKEMSNCQNSYQGIRLQLQAEMLTSRIAVPTRLPFVPYISFGGEISDELLEYALEDFVSTVCMLIQNQAPICERKFHQQNK